MPNEVLDYVVGIVGSDGRVRENLVKASEYDITEHFVTFRRPGNEGVKISIASFATKNVRTIRLKNDVDE